jgi:putative tricarboxylic transport membrane protein
MRRTPWVEGLVLVALGVASVVEALRLKDDWQGAKLMPAVVGGLLVLLGCAHFVRRGPRVAWPPRDGVRRVIVLLAVVALYVAVLPRVGFVPATAALVLSVVRTVGPLSWPRTAVATAVIAVASHIVFRHWLGMPLPAGPLGY